MTRNTVPEFLVRGQRTDLHITTLRNEAENAFGGIFAEAADLRHKLDDPGFADDDYDAAVIGFICGAVLRVRPLPTFLRQSLGILLGLAPAKRADLVTIPVVGRQSSVQARSDRAAIELVIDNAKDNLYPPASFAGGLTDLGCGLEGLHLTWRRDILSEAHSAGVISVEGLRRIRSKLSQAIADSVALNGVVLFDQRGSAIKAVSDDSTRKALERRYKLVQLIEHAVSIGSSVQCIPAHVREERISAAYRIEAREELSGASNGSPESRRSGVSENVELEARGRGDGGRGSRVNVRELLPTDGTPFDNPQIYSVPRRN
jgi:hypothetical protein